MSVSPATARTLIAELRVLGTLALTFYKANFWFFNIPGYSPKNRLVGRGKIGTLSKAGKIIGPVRCLESGRYASPN